jgi:hypothetical protein
VTDWKQFNELHYPEPGGHREKESVQRRQGGKGNSRTRIGVVPTTKVLKHKNKAAPKHPKKELDEALDLE